MSENNKYTPEIAVIVRQLQRATPGALRIVSLLIKEIERRDMVSIPCDTCGLPVEPARTCYGRPVCYRCLPPPEPLPVA